MPECQDPSNNPPQATDGGAESLSRAMITDAAIRLIEDQGLGKLSMRALAASLGCGTMSLYSYVRNREDLVGAIVQELLNRSAIPEVTRSEFSRWQALVTASLMAYRDLAVAYPASFELLALAPYDVVPVAEHLEGLVGALKRAGVPSDRAYEILGALDAYATGFLVVWARTQVSRPQSDGDASARLKSLRALEMYESGLRIFIEGFERDFDSGRGSER